MTITIEPSAANSTDNNVRVETPDYAISFSADSINANGGFTYVLSSAWYFGAVGSAKRFGIVNGTSATTFAPNNTILKNQIVAICVRTLREEMGYRSP